MAETIGSVQVVAKINTKDYDAAKKQIEKSNNELEGNAKKTSSGFNAAWAGILAGATAAIVSKGIGKIVSAMDGAIARVDTLDNAKRTFSNMGIASGDTAKAMKLLEKSITGLPTPLDSAVRGMTSLTATYGDVGKGQKVFSALNNAILGFGGTASQVDNAIMQLSQLPMDGPLDAQTWNSLRNSGITPVLTAMAKDSGVSVSQMKEAFGKGELTVQDFTDRLLKLNKDGGGGMKSLERIAKDSTSGISTGMANMNTAVTKGVAEIIKAIGSKNITNAISAIGTGFRVALVSISSVINFVKSNSRVFIQLATVVGAAGVAILTYNTYLKASAIVSGGVATATALLNGVMLLQAQGVGAVRAAWLLLNTTMAANPIGLVVGAVAGLVSILAMATIQSNSSKSATDRLTTARQGLKTATDNQKLAEQSLRDAQLAAAGTALAVERAQLSYNSAVKQFGPTSLEAREALHQLKLAQQSNTEANKRAADEQKKVIDNNREIIKQKDLVKAALDGAGGSAQNASNGYKNLAAQMSAANEQARKKDFKAVSNTLFTVGGKGFSSGGFTGRGGVNQMAGIVHRGEYVVPKKDVDQSTGKPKLSALDVLDNLSFGDNSRAGATINQTNNVYTELDMDIVNRNLTWELNRA